MGPFNASNELNWRKEADSTMKWTMDINQKNFPRCDLYDAGDAFILEAEIPGLELSDVHVQIINNELLLNGNCNTMIEGNPYYLKERPHVTFNKKITLPSHVLTEGIRYSLKKGILKMILPKEEEEVVLFIQKED